MSNNTEEIIQDLMNYHGYSIDFSIVTDEDVEKYINEDVKIDSPDDICTVCYTKLRWINLYYQCTDCKRIYG